MKPRAVGTKHGTGHVPATDGRRIDAPPVVPIETKPAASRSRSAPRRGTSAASERTAGRCQGGSRGSVNRSPSPDCRSSTSIRRPRWPTCPRSALDGRKARRRSGPYRRRSRRARNPTTSPCGSSWAHEGRHGARMADPTRGWPAECRTLRSLDVKILVACGICEPEGPRPAASRPTSSIGSTCSFRRPRASERSAAAASRTSTWSRGGSSRPGTHGR